MRTQSEEVIFQVVAHRGEEEKHYIKTFTHEEVDESEKRGGKKERFWPGKLPKKKVCTFLS